MINDDTFVSAQIVTAGNGMSSTSASLSPKLTIIGLFCNFSYTSMISDEQTHADKIMENSQKIL